jgi:prephenate dehydratase
LEVLLKLLSVFSFHNFSMTKLEMNPQGNAPLRVLDIDAKGGAAVRQFEYVFYIDFEASEADPHAQRALEEVRRFTTFVQVLGCYVARPKNPHP